MTKRRDEATRVREALGLAGGNWDVSSSEIGHGQVARCTRYEFTRGDEVHCAVAKVPSDDEVSRATARAQALYLREVSFYSRLADKVAIRTPRVLHAERDDETDDFLLVLEDLTPAEYVEQFHGLSSERARLALTELAGLHGPTAGRSELFAERWLDGVSAETGPLYVAVLPALFQQFLERYRSSIDHKVRDVVAELGERLISYVSYDPALRCVIHGDYRSENMIFAGRGGEVPLAIVDWQTVMTGSPMLDVAYFTVTSLTTEHRRNWEDALIEHYLEALAEHGVKFDESTARDEYARYTLQPVVMLVAASMIVERTDRGDEMFLTMIRRGVTAVEDWDALAAIE